MTDERPGTEPGAEPASEPDLGPVEDERIRSLLADLRAPAVPEDVAARLDETLAGLVAERHEAPAHEAPAHEAPAPGDSPDRGTLVPLRRRWVKIGTIAAAAVIVVGVGGVAVTELGQGGLSADSATAGRAESDTADEGGGAADLAPSPAPSGEAQGESLARALPAVRSRAFAADVTRLLDTPAALRAVPEQGTGKPGAPPAECPGPDREGTTTLPVRYDGTLAALVLHPTEGGRRLVEAWDCSGGARLASAQVAPRD